MGHEIKSGEMESETRENINPGSEEKEDGLATALDKKKPPAVVAVKMSEFLSFPDEVDSSPSFHKENGSQELPVDKKTKDQLKKEKQKEEQLRKKKEKEERKLQEKKEKELKKQAKLQEKEAKKKSPGGAKESTKPETNLEPSLSNTGSVIPNLAECDKTSHDKADDSVFQTSIPLESEGSVNKTTPNDAPNKSLEPESSVSDTVRIVSNKDDAKTEKQKAKLEERFVHQELKKQQQFEAESKKFEKQNQKQLKKEQSAQQALKQKKNKIGLMDKFHLMPKKSSKVNSDDDVNNLRTTREKLDSNQGPCELELIILTEEIPTTG